MTGVWVIFAAVLAIARSQSRPPAPVRYARATGLANDDSSSSSSYEQWEQPINPGFTQQSNPRLVITASGLKMVDPHCPGCPYLIPQALDGANRLVLKASNANPLFFADDASPAHVAPVRLQSVYQAPAHLRTAQEAATRLIKPQPSYVQHSIPVQASSAQTAPSSVVIAKSQINPVFAQQANPMFISARGQPLAAEDAIAVEVSPRSPLFTAFPEAPRYNPQQSAATPTVAHIAILEDGTPVIVGLAAAQALQTPQTFAVRYMTPQQVHSQGLDAQPSALFQENATPIQVIPVGVKTFQPAQSPVFTVIPQDASVKFINAQ